MLLEFQLGSFLFVLFSFFENQIYSLGSCQVLCAFRLACRIDGWLEGGLHLKYVALLTESLVKLALVLHDAVLPILQKAQVLRADCWQLLLRDVEQANLPPVLLHPVEMHVLDRTHQSLQVQQLRRAFIAGTRLLPQRIEQLLIAHYGRLCEPHSHKHVESRVFVHLSALFCELKRCVNRAQVPQEALVDKLG